ncbi:MAG: carboxypeptidase-like regulatory domain-containing protein [Candidatus Methanoplasma sp.]|jgi:hypothetical protein|nr:carboxypeptidase-like regulatory domain-containing protein [Candidatus Methanoplasma sp.]
MSKKLLLAVVASVMLMLILPLSSSDADVNAPNYAVEGYVAEGGGAGKIPLDNVTVSIKGPQDVVQSVTTDSDGFFSIVVSSNKGLSIKFTAPGYIILTCPYTTGQTGSEYLTLDLLNAPYSSASRTYTITSSVDGMQPVLMQLASDSSIRGTVYFSGNAVKDVTITITNGADVYSTKTNDRGYYEIWCPVGSYTIIASGAGFKTSNEISADVTSTPLNVNITMEKKDLKMYLGLDVAHILMLVGVIVGILLAVAAWLLSERMNGPNRLEFFDDSEEEDDDIRYP